MEESDKSIQKESSDIQTGIKADKSDLIIEIYEKYNVRLKSFLVRHLNKKSDVDDVAQEVYFRIIKYWQPDGRTPSLQMLYTIALNIIKNRFNRQKSPGAHPHVPINDINMASDIPSPEDILMYQKRVDTIKSVYKGLKEDSRRAFSLHRFNGNTYEEIAEKMGISKSMVQKHISLTLSKLRKKIVSIK